jgi:hypothetical protein
LGGGGVSVIADALGLRHAPASERAGAIAASRPAAFGAISAKRVDKSLQNLDLLLNGQGQDLTTHDVAGLAERPDLLGPRAERMSAAFAAAAQGGPRTREASLVLRRLLSMLSPSDFHRVGDRLLSTYSDGLVTMAPSDNDQLATRLGDLGTRALPMLDHHAAGNGGGNAYVILGLCRIGGPAAGAADRISAILRSAGSRGDWGVRTAGYVTLLRMGRPDLADRYPLEDSKYAEMRRTVGPASPASVCVDNFGWPTLPAAA